MSCIEFAQKRQERTDETDESRYTGSVTPVKRDRDWTPDESAATKAAVSAMECGFAICAPFMVARQAGASLAGSRKRVPGSPTCRATALIGLGAVVFENRTSLEPIMAISAHAHTSVPTPTTGNPDPIQLHMRAVNMLNRCKVLIMADEPMYTFALQDLEAAQQAIAALRSLEG